MNGIQQTQRINQYFKEYFLWVFFICLFLDNKKDAFMEGIDKK